MVRSEYLKETLLGNMFFIRLIFAGELLICDTNDNMTTMSFEWHSQAVSEALWFVRSDLRVLLLTAGKDGYVCIANMVSEKIKFTQRICRYVKYTFNKYNF